MKTLKVRAWDKEDAAYLHITKNEEDGVVGISPDGEKALYLEDGEVIILEDVIIEQYTGLKDKNGKEIYEGDIVKCYSQDTYPMGKVIYSEEWAVYKIVAYDAEQRVYTLEHFSPIISEYLEVVGNIHENPELVGSEE